jgi:GH24 family phage-related lysozyme (muramidase)
MVGPVADVRPPSPAVAVPTSILPERAIALIVAFEVGSPELYRRKYQSPIYPGGASGPTVGVGYDLGHTLDSVIIADWEAHPHAARMATASGLKGEPKSLDWVRRHADIAVEWEMARKVFDQTSVVEHYRLAKRAFGPDFVLAPALCQGALVSVVFNRGASMQGPNRSEMRVIRDKCLPDGNMQCVADNIRSMARINAGTSIAKGIERRRNAEGDLCDA